MSNNQSQHRYPRALDWEDARAVLDMCKSIQGSVASVGGSGDIALSFLTTSITSLTVMCLDESEKMLLELKLQAIRSSIPIMSIIYWVFIQVVAVCLHTIRSRLSVS